MDTIGECFQYCLSQGGDHVEQQHLACMLDAWDLLNASATLTARGSPLATELDRTCATAVKGCEETCAGFDGDPTMQACADVCHEAYEHLAA